MKKNFLLCSFIALIIFFIKILRRNRCLIPLGIRFSRPNGSHVKLRTIFKEPGQ